MKSAGVFLGGLGSVLGINLMLIGVCSSAPAAPAPAAPIAPPTILPPPAIVRVIPRAPEMQADPVPLGVFLWGCGTHRTADPEGALPLPICAPRFRL